MKIDVKIEGLKDLDAALSELKQSTAKGVLRRTARKALGPIAQSARDLAPDDPATDAPKDLKSSIIISPRQKSSRFSGFGTLGTLVQMFVGPSADGYPQAMVQEFGAKPHRIIPKAARRGRAGRRARKAGGGKLLGFDAGGESVVVGEVMHPGHPPRPYMRPAWERHKDELLPRIAQLLGEEIQKTVQRAAKRAARLAARKG